MASRQGDRAQRLSLLHPAAPRSRWGRAARRRQSRLRPGPRAKTTRSLPRQLRRLQNLKRNLVVLIDGERQCLADNVVQLVRRQAVTRRLEREILEGENAAGLERARRDNLLAHFHDGA